MLRFAGPVCDLVLGPQARLHYKRARKTPQLVAAVKSYSETRQWLIQHFLRKDSFKEQVQPSLGPCKRILNRVVIYRNL